MLSIIHTLSCLIDLVVNSKKQNKKEVTSFLSEHTFSEGYLISVDFVNQKV